jgi:hypothetical protein
LRLTGVQAAKNHAQEEKPLPPATKLMSANEQKVTPFCECVERAEGRFRPRTTAAGDFLPMN